MEMISWENYEEYMMMHADGELTRAEEAILLEFVKNHPELKQEMEGYELTRVQPDNNVVYEYKENLLKPVAERRVIAMPQWRRYSIAAGIALLISIGLILNREPGKVEITAKAEHEAQPAGAIVKNAGNPLQTDDTAVPKDEEMQPVLPQSGWKTVAANREKSEHIAPVIPRGYAIAEVTPAVPVFLNCTSSIAAPEPIAIPEYAVAIAGDEEKKSLLELLPMDDLKRKSLEQTAAAVASAYQHINTVKQKINEASLTITVEKRKLVLSF